MYNADAACALPGVLTELLADSAAPRPGRLARLVLLPAVPGYLAAGRLHGARTLLPGRIDLSWDLRAGAVRAELTSHVSQPIELTCATAPAADTAGPGGAGWHCTASVPTRSLRPGTWRLDLTAAHPAQIALDWAPKPEPAPPPPPPPGPGRPRPRPRPRVSSTWLNHSVTPDCVNDSATQTGLRGGGAGGLRGMGEALRGELAGRASGRWRVAPRCGAETACKLGRKPPGRNGQR